jgi:uncharacterized protein YndB with AHSA1/START domain
MSSISPSNSLTRFTTSVRIARPVAAVFAFVADPRTFPDWNSAVERVVAKSRPTPAVGARYAMSRLLPDGRASNDLEIVTWDPPSEFAIQTTSGPTPFVYRYSFTPEDGGTLVRLLAEFELGAPALIQPLVARGVKRGVDANFSTLRAILERT